MILSSCPWEQQSPSPFDDEREEILDTFHIPTSPLFDSSSSSDDDDKDKDDIIYDSQPSPKVPSSPLLLRQPPSPASVYHTCPDSQSFGVLPPPPTHISLSHLPNSDLTMAEINSNPFANNTEDQSQSPLHIPSSLMETFLPPDDYSDRRQYFLPSTMPELPSLPNYGWSTQDDDDEEL